MIGICVLLEMLKWSLLAQPLLAGASVIVPAFTDASDLTRFVTRPEIKAPLLTVTTYDSESLDDGYIFVGAYSDLIQPRPHGSLYHSCQTGPHIYDQTGELVWSGACDFENLVACDFRAFEANGTSYLSAIFTHTSVDPKGYGLILDNSYSPVRRLDALPGTIVFNMHELTFVNNGSRALYIINKPRFVDLSAFLDDVEQVDSGWILDLGIYEMDLATGEATFTWWASEHIDLEESNAVFQDYQQRAGGWNWLHINSVNKNDDGDYIISARFTDAIYKISGADGSILWRLGGTKSTFEMVNFNFSRQHDAQWIAYDKNVELISFLDNGADNYGFSTSTVSSALVVRLDKTAGYAQVVERIWRPDGALSELRGNVQNLPSGNRFVGWSDNAYMTEHDPEGNLLLSASFSSHRFVTYRAYKFPFQGFPVEKPVLHASAYTAGTSSITAFYVSWNGATNVRRWAFWRLEDYTAEPVLIGEAQKTGFETAFQAEGCERLVFAVALDYSGAELGRTDVFEVVSRCSADHRDVHHGAREKVPMEDHIKSEL